MPLYTEIWGPVGRPLPALLPLLQPLLALLATLALLDVWGTGSSFSMACAVAQSGRSEGRRAGGCWEQRGRSEMSHGCFLENAHTCLSFPSAWGGTASPMRPESNLPPEGQGQVWFTR